MVPSERALVSSYRPSNVSSIFTRLRDIAAFVLQHATFSLSHLYSILKMSHDPLGVGGPPFGYTKIEGVGLIVCTISFQDFQPSM